MLKTIFTLACLIASHLCCAHVRLNTYEVRQQMITDSLRVIDSIRIVDSTKVADSLFVARYASSDRSHRRRVKKETLQAKAEDSARKAFVPMGNSESDIFSARSIVIPEGHENAGKIDSLQGVIDSISVELYQKDTLYHKMIKYPLSEKKRYFTFLLQNRIKDTSQVFSWCESMHTMLCLEQAKMFLIVKTQQDENAKSFLMLHLKRTQLKMGELSGLMVSFSPKAPGRIEHLQPEKQLTTE
jgi:hypothetical protein